MTAVDNIKCERDTYSKMEQGIHWFTIISIHGFNNVSFYVGWYGCASSQWKKERQDKNTFCFLRVRWAMNSQLENKDNCYLLLLLLHLYSLRFEKGTFLYSLWTMLEYKSFIYMYICLHFPGATVQLLHIVTQHWNKQELKMPRTFYVSSFTIS